jgi:hypothetical protein
VFLLLVLAALFLQAQEPPPVGGVELYGLRTLRDADVLNALRIAAGDPIHVDALRAAEARIAKLPRVKAARVTATCCDNGRAIVYAGIVETKPLTFAAAPHSSVRLPETIRKTASDLQTALEVAVMSGKAGEDRSHGQSLSDDETARALQQRLISLAQTDSSTLRAILRTSSSESDRATAAEVIAYLPDKRSVSTDLLRATDDPSPDVRNAALRSLAVIGELPGAEQWIDWRPIARLLDSVEWSDRNKAAAVLSAITRTHRDPRLMRDLASRHVLSVAEMARWKSPQHAMNPFYLLGRAAGQSERDIAQFWAGRDVAGLLARIR